MMRAMLLLVLAAGVFGCSGAASHSDMYACDPNHPCQSGYTCCDDNICRAACGGLTGKDVGRSRRDAGGKDDSGNVEDAGHVTDSGVDDAGSPDTVGPDSGQETDSGSMDYGFEDHPVEEDVGAQDAVVPDGGVPDAGTPDTGVTDVGGEDAGDLCFNYNCLCGSYCKVSGGIPACTSGCQKSGDCCSGKECKNNDCIVKTCGLDADCSGTTPHCNTATGECKECVYDNHCANGYHCEKTSYTCQVNTPMCKSCTSDIDCISAGVTTCGSFTKKCTKQCATEADCMGFACDVFGYCTCP